LRGSASLPSSQTSRTLGGAIGSRASTATSAFPFVPQQESLSLLARVTKVEDRDSSQRQPSTSNAEPSAFFWPPVRKFDDFAARVLRAELNAPAPPQTTGALSVPVETDEGPVDASNPCTSVPGEAKPQSRDSEDVGESKFRTPYLNLDP
jgi:hypothetical protein